MRVASLPFLTLAGAVIASMMLGTDVAVAQEFYVGTAYDAASMTGDVGGESLVETDTTGLQAFAGARVQIGKLGFLGGEFETSLGAVNTDGVLSWGPQDQLRRIRAVAGRKLGAATVFATIGQARYGFSDLPAGDTVGGKTFGIGGEFTVGDRFILRAEAIHDSIDGGSPDYRIDSTSIRAAAVINF